jgi:hypothetical protein
VCLPHRLGRLVGPDCERGRDAGRNGSGDGQPVGGADRTLLTQHERGRLTAAVSLKINDQHLY